MNKDNDNSSRARKTPSKSFSQILIESDIPFAPTIGKFLQLFVTKYGRRTVFIFIFGFLFALIPIYGYTLIFEHLPFIKNHFPVNGVTNDILLHGNVRIQKIGRSAETFKNEFEVVLGTAKGPFNTKEISDGSFKIIVPLLQEYSIVVMCDKNYKYFGNRVVAEINGTYSLLDTLILHDNPWLNWRKNYW